MSIFSKMPSGIALAAAMMLAAQAISADNFLIVRFQDGTATSFNLTHRPNVTFDGGRMVIASEDMETSYDAARVKRFTFGDDTNEIAPVLTENEVRLTYTSPEAATLSGLKHGERVSLFSTDGIMLMTLSADESGVAELNLSSLSKGVFIISVSNGQSFKIAR